MSSHLARVLTVVALCCASLFAQGWVDRSAVNGPPQMRGHSMCWDPIRNYTLLVKPSYGQLETWSWNGATWTNRGTHAAAWLNWQGGLNTQGGVVYQANTGQVCFLACQRNNSLNTATCWASTWDGTTWSAPTTAVLGGSFQTNWNDHRVTAVYDPARSESILVQNGNPGAVIVFDGTNFTLRTAINPHGLPMDTYTNTDLEYFAAVDPSTGKVLATQRHWTIWARFFEWNGQSWNQRLPSPAPYRGGAMASDTPHQCIVMFDGDAASTSPNHTWTYANGEMNRIVVGLEPSLRTGAAMSFDPVRGVSVLFGGANAYGSLLGDTWEFDLGPPASFASYGTGCIGSRGVPNLAAQGTSLPRIGSTFTAHVTNLPWTGPAFLVLGLSNATYGSTPLPIDLGFLGAPGCSLRTSIDDLQPVVNILGSATWSWTIPPFPGHPFYVQVLPIDPGTNALALTASNACHGVIGL